MKHLGEVGTRKKKTRFAGLFFLTGLRPVLPLGPLRCSSNIAIADHCPSNCLASPCLASNPSKSRFARLTFDDIVSYDVHIDAFGHVDVGIV